MTTKVIAKSGSESSISEASVHSQHSTHSDKEEEQPESEHKENKDAAGRQKSSLPGAKSLHEMKASTVEGESIASKCVEGRKKC